MLRKVLIACIIIFLAALVTVGISVALQRDLLGGATGRPNWPGLILLFAAALVGVATLTQAVVALADWLGRRDSVPAAPVAAPPRFDEAHLRRQRGAMLDAVDRQWIEGRLARSLHNQAPIFLGLTEQPAAVRRPWEYEIQTPEEPARRAWDTGEILRVFRSCGALLILGAPGAGKTVTLLDLARQLIADARQDAAQPMPVVFVLASWARKKLPVTEWMIEELQRQYRVPPELGRWWVERFEVLPLLDGLDEVEESARRACVEAINAYRGHVAGGAPLVVCCRAAEYAALSAALEAEAAVTIQPLTGPQIEQYIGRLGAAGEPVRRMLADNAQLAELAQAPLWLDVMTVAYARDGATPTPAPGAPADIFDDYIRRVLLRHRDPLREFPPAQSLRWLRWLARQLDRTEQTVLRLDAMQPDWLPGAAEQKRYRRWLSWGVGVFSGALLLPGFSLLVGRGVASLVSNLGAAFWDSFKAFQPGLALAVTVIWSAVMGLAFGLDAGSSDEPTGRFIAATAGVHWNAQSARREIRQSLFHEWKLPALLVLLAAAPAVIKGDLWLAGTLAFVVLLASKAVLMLLGAVYDGIEPIYAVQVETHPDGELTRTWRGAVLGGIAFGALTTLTFAAFDWLGRGFNGAVATFLLTLPGMVFLGWLLNGGRTIIRHALLRWRLWQLGLMPKPWRYVAFLQTMSAHLLLDRIGGAYKFKHDLLQRHIAQLDEAYIASFEPGPRR